MHAPFDRSAQADKRNSPHSRGRFADGSGFLIFPILIAIVLIVSLVAEPKISSWIAAAVEAEYVGGSGIADAPTQLAQPDMQIRTVRAY